MEIEKKNEQIIENENKEKQNNENTNIQLTSENEIKNEEKKENINNNIENISPINELKNEKDNINKEISKEIQENLVETKNQEIDNNNKPNSTKNQEYTNKEKIYEYPAPVKEEEKEKKIIKVNVKPNSDIKQKGYVRILRNIIKRKHKTLNNNVRKSFILWKVETLKGLRYRKTIIVRISISTEKDNKQRINTDEKLNKSSETKSKFKSFTKILNTNPKKKNIGIGVAYKAENKPTYVNHNLKNHSVFMSPKENKDSKRAIYNKLNINDIGINGIKGINGINGINNKRQNKLIEVPNKEKKQLNYSRSSIDYKTNDTSHYLNNKLDNTFQQLNSSRNNKPRNHNYNNTSNDLYKLINNNNPIKNIKKNIDKNTTKILNKNYEGYFSQSNIYSPNQSRNNTESNTIINQSLNVSKPYNTKKFIPLSKNPSSKIKTDNYSSYFTNVYQNKDKNNNLIKKEPYKIKIDFNNYTMRRENKIKNPEKTIDKETLKKGVTSVVQHYSGVREKLNNYDKNTLKTIK